MHQELQNYDRNEVTKALIRVRAPVLTPLEEEVLQVNQGVGTTMTPDRMQDTNQMMP